MIQLFEETKYEIQISKPTPIGAIWKIREICEKIEKWVKENRLDFYKTKNDDITLVKYIIIKEILSIPVTVLEISIQRPAFSNRKECYISYINIRKYWTIFNIVMFITLTLLASYGILKQSSSGHSIVDGINYALNVLWVSILLLFYWRIINININIENVLNYLKIDKIKELQEKLKALEGELRVLEPLKALRISPKLLKSYKTIKPFVGFVKVDPRPKIKEITEDFLAVLKDYGDEYVIAVFVKVDYAEDVFRVLQECGFREVTISDIEDFDTRISEIETEISLIQEEIKRLESGEERNISIVDCGVINIGWAFKLFIVGITTVAVPMLLKLLSVLSTLMDYFFWTVLALLISLIYCIYIISKNMSGFSILLGEYFFLILPALISWCCFCTAVISSWGFLGVVGSSYDYYEIEYFGDCSHILSGMAGDLIFVVILLLSELCLVFGVIMWISRKAITLRYGLRRAKIAKVDKRIHYGIPFLLLWILFSVATWMCLISLANFILRLLGIKQLLPDLLYYNNNFALWEGFKGVRFFYELSTAYGYEKYIVILYICIFIILFPAILILSLTIIGVTLSILRRVRKGKEAPDWIVEIVKKASKLAGIREPIEVYIKKDNKPYASSASYGIFSLKHRITISDGLINLLSKDELKAAIYHEVYHLKYNTRLKNILNLISTLSLTGRGTLTAIVGFSSEEYSADEFAARHTSPEIVLNLLRKLREHGMRAYLRSDYEFRDMSLKLVLWDKFTKTRSLIREFCELWMSELPTYYSPTLEDRMEYIKEKFNINI